MTQRRRALLAAMGGSDSEDPSSTVGWVFGYRFNTVGQTAQASCCITTMIAVSGGDIIQTCIPNYGDANIGVFGYEDEFDTGHWFQWAGRGDLNGRINVPNGINFIRVSLFISVLDTTFLYNMTSGKYLYKGKDV